MFTNIVIGNPVCEPWQMFSKSVEEWERDDKKQTLFTDTKFLPAVLVEAGIVKSISEVRRNKPELMINLNNTDFLEIKWGKKRVFIQIE